MTVTKIHGKFLVRLDPTFGFRLPDEMSALTSFWTDKITYEDDGSVTFEPVNTFFGDNWPKAINIHMTNCVIFKMQDS